MRKLPGKAIKEYQTIYRKEYGIYLDEKEARQQARNLLRFMDAITYAKTYDQQS